MKYTQLLQVRGKIGTVALEAKTFVLDLEKYRDRENDLNFRDRVEEYSSKIVVSREEIDKFVTSNRKEFEMKTRVFLFRMY